MADRGHFGGIRHNRWFDGKFLLFLPTPDSELTNPRQIGAAWLMGAHFEKMFDPKAPGTVVPPAITHGEL